MGGRCDPEGEGRCDPEGEGRCDPEGGAAIRRGRGRHGAGLAAAGQSRHALCLRGHTTGAAPLTCDV